MENTMVIKKIAYLSGVVLAGIILAGNTTASRDLVDSWNKGVIDHFNECISTIGGTNSCLALRQLFKIDSANLSFSGKKQLKKTVSELNEAEHITVIGHTDSVGTEKYNLNLSKRRAQSVKKYLLSQGVRSKFDVVGMGESKPVDNNSTAIGRAHNRRVEINF